MRDHDYEVACKLVSQDISFRALLMAAFKRADTYNFSKLALSFPAEHRKLLELHEGRNVKWEDTSSPKT